MAMLRILSSTCIFFGIVLFIAGITGYERAFLSEAFLLVVGGFVLEAFDRIVSSLKWIHTQPKELNGSENN